MRSDPTGSEGGGSECEQRSDSAVTTLHCPWSRQWRSGVAGRWICGGEVGLGDRWSGVVGCAVQGHFNCGKLAIGWVGAIGVVFGAVVGAEGFASAAAWKYRDTCRGTSLSTAVGRGVHSRGTSPRRECAHPARTAGVSTEPRTASFKGRLGSFSGWGRVMA